MKKMLIILLLISQAVICATPRKVPYMAKKSIPMMDRVQYEAYLQALHDKFTTRITYWSNHLMSLDDHDHKNKSLMLAKKADLESHRTVISAILDIIHGADVMIIRDRLISLIHESSHETFKSRIEQALSDDGVIKKLQQFMLENEYNNRANYATLPYAHYHINLI